MQRANRKYTDAIAAVNGVHSKVMTGISGDDALPFVSTALIPAPRMISGVYFDIALLLSREPLLLAAAVPSSLAGADGSLEDSSSLSKTTRFRVFLDLTVAGKARAPSESLDESTMGVLS